MSATDTERRLEAALRGEADALAISDGWDSIQRRIRRRPYRRVSALAVALAVLVASSVVVPKLLHGDVDKAHLIGPRPGPGLRDRDENDKRTSQGPQGQGRRAPIGRQPVGAAPSRVGTRGDTVRSSRGGAIAFVVGWQDDPTAREGIYVMNPDGSARTYVGAGAHPAWSPDGRTIAYTHTPDDCAYEPCSEIWAMDADGSDRRRVTAGRTADWSPDGKQIVFQRGDRIYLSNADGSKARRLTADESATVESSPDWSPDGRQIAYSLRTPEDGVNGSYEYIWIFDIATRKEHAICCDDGWGATDPVWSSDGKRIAFSLVTHENGATFNETRINVVTSDGSGRKQVTKPRRGDEVTTEEERPEKHVHDLRYYGDFWPAWSRDNSHIAFTRFDRVGTAEPGRIYVIKPDGSGLEDLGPGRFPDYGRPAR